MKFEAKLELFNNKLWNYHVKIPQPIFEELYKTCSDKRVKCTIFDVETFQCAMMPDGNGGYFIMLNKERRDKFNIQVGTLFQIDLIPDTSKYGIDLCEELEEMLYQDPIATTYFDKLTPRKQRSLIHLVGKYKNSETRLNKAIIVLNHLVNRNGLLDFKILHEDFKNANI
jgi:hypothetical protein